MNGRRAWFLAGTVATIAISLTGCGDAITVIADGKFLLVLAAQDRDAADRIRVCVKAADRTGKGQFSGRAGNEGGGRSHRFEVPPRTSFTTILAVCGLEC